MLDIKAIRKDPEFYRQALRARSADYAGVIDELLEIDQTRRAGETETQRLQGERKILSKEIGKLKSQGESAEEIMAQVAAIKTSLETIAAQADAAEQKQRDLLLHLPNIPHENCPAGADETANPVLREWGELPEFTFQPQGHQALGEGLGLFDFARAAKISGSGYVVFTGKGARLERGLIQFLLDLHTQEHGYVEYALPHLVNRPTMTGTGQLPKFAEDAFAVGEVESAEQFLIPTAEVPLTNLWANELLAVEQLPILATAYTPCFRKEAGSAGAGTRGLIRMHQFDKVEMVRLVEPEKSMEALEELTAQAEKVLQLLGLPYRVIELCAGDLGFSACKTYDLEVWAPGQQGWLEVSSCSNFADYQARRMNLRFKDKEGVNRPLHTLNGSGTALPRLVVALLENYQQEDGSVHLPEILRPYLGFTTISAAELA